MVAVRLDPRVRRRIDVADVLQEAFLEVSRRLPEYLEKRPMPFFLWVRLLTGQKLSDLHDHHLGTRRRDAAQEVPRGGVPAATSVSLAGAFVDPGSGPVRASMRKEALEKVQAALEKLDEVDREILALRYFERLSNDETAAVLGMTPSGAKKRHARALVRLRGELPHMEDLPTP
jgi:RNA polymerase sigma-70 factor (ECF subfamily)